MFRGDIINGYADCTENSSNQRGKRNSEAVQIAVRRQKEDAKQREGDCNQLIGVRFPFQVNTGTEQNHDGGKILQNRGNTGSGELNGQKIQKLTETYAEKTIDNQFKSIAAAFPGLEKKFCTIALQAEEKENDAGKAEADRNQPAAVHSLSGKKILSHGTGKSPAGSTGKCQ